MQKTRVKGPLSEVTTTSTSREEEKHENPSKNSALNHGAPGAHRKAEMQIAAGMPGPVARVTAHHDDLAGAAMDGGKRRQAAVHGLNDLLARSESNVVDEAQFNGHGSK